MTDSIMTAKEIATELRCSKAQVYRLLNGVVKDVPQLPHISLGRKKIVRRSSLDHWKRANEQGTLKVEPETSAVDRMH